MTKLITGLNAIIDSYDTYVIDQWGVLHDGYNALPGALDAIKALKAHNKTIIILSNSGRRACETLHTMNTLGFTPDTYDHFLTSGEQVHQSFANRQGAYANLGYKFRLYTFTHTTGDPYDLTDGLNDYTRVDSINDADFILASAMEHPPEYYEPEFTTAIACNMPMVVGNPDRVSINPDGTLHYCPGELGVLYENMGGTVLWNGKPTHAIYDMLRQKIGGEWGRAIGIGDSLAHDIQGAENAHIHSWFIAQGIHREHIGFPQNMTEHGMTDNTTLPDTDAIKKLATDYGVSPTYTSTYFAL